MKHIQKIILIIALGVVFSMCKKNDPEPSVITLPQSETNVYSGDTYGRQFDYSDNFFTYKQYGSFNSDGIPESSNKFKIERKGNDSVFVYITKNNKIDYFYIEINGIRQEQLFEFKYDGPSALLVVSDYNWTTEEKTPHTTFDLSTIYTETNTSSLRLKSTGTCDDFVTEIVKQNDQISNEWIDAGEFASNVALAAGIVTTAVTTAPVATVVVTAAAAAAGVYVVAKATATIVNVGLSWFQSATQRRKTKGAVMCQSKLPPDPEPDPTPDPEPKCSVLMSCEYTDCNGVTGGSAFYDECDICIGGNTGKAPCSLDCNGDIDGSAYYDDCENCVGGNTGKDACTIDCNGDIDGGAFIDNCGDCVGGSTGKSECSDTLRVATDLIK